jgi:hypothetical protein
MATYKELLAQAYSANYHGVPNEKDCSGFIISAAQAVGVHLPAMQADGLLGYMEANWDRLGGGDLGLKAGKSAAARGAFVVVGASAAELRDTNGHVAVLLGRTRDGWPLVYGGARNVAARTQGEKTLNYVFRRAYHSKLRYFSPKFTIIPAFDSD